MDFHNLKFTIISPVFLNFFSQNRYPQLVYLKHAYQQRKASNNIATGEQNILIQNLKSFGHENS